MRRIWNKEKIDIKRDRLWVWILKMGGINYNREHLKGELRQLAETGIGMFLINKKNEGYSLDYLVESAKEYGYITEEDTIRELLNKIFQDLQNQKVYSIYNEKIFEE